MKTVIKLVASLLVAGSVEAAISDFSGSYAGALSGYTVAMGVTKGGRITGGAYSSVDDADVINPKSSYVRSNGTFSGKTYGGTSFSGKLTKTSKSVSCNVKALGATKTFTRGYK